MDKKTIKKYVLLFFYSFVVRILYLFIVKGFNAEMQGDEGGYLLLGDYFLGRASDSFYIFRAPLAGFIYSPFFLIFGSSSQLARIVNVIISSLYAPLIYKILSGKVNNQKISYFLSFFWVFYPPSIFYASMITSETLAGLLILILSIFIMKNQDKIQNKNIFIIGIVCGLISLTRSSYYYLPFFILIYYIFKFGFHKNFLKSYLILFASFYFVISPLIIYNYFTFNAFVPSEPRLGYGLYLCNNDLNHPDIIKGGYFRDDFLKERKHKNEDLSKVYLEDLALKEKALNYMLDNKSQLILPMINRYINFWSYRPNPIKNYYTINDLIMFIIWIPIFLAYLFSLAANKSNRFDLFNIIIFYTSITVIPFWGIPRFRFPVDSMILINTALFFEKKFYAKKN